MEQQDKATLRGTDTLAGSSIHLLDGLRTAVGRGIWRTSLLCGLQRLPGLPVTFGGWVEKRLDEIVAKYANSDITVKSIKNMKEELRDIGMDSYEGT